MLLLGGAVVKVSMTGMYLRFVRPGLRPLLIVCGLLLVAGGVMTLWYELRARATSEADVDDDGHGHAHGEPRVGWLVLLPVLVLLLIAPPALGSFAAGRAGSALAAQGSASDFAPLPSTDPVSLRLLDYASRAVFDHGRSLTGHTLSLSGFVTSGRDGAPMLTRIVVSCCAADGRSIKVGLSGNVPSSVAADTWIQVVGTYTPATGTDPANGSVVPYLQVTAWQLIPMPNQPYE
jgi:uncharacterized repeat protein (TIGR03943 family)